jgi:polyisoprenoid-binding protein YceI
MRASGLSLAKISIRNFLLAALLLLGGCTFLLTPKVTTNIETLRAGQYKLDPTHTSVLFKVQHLQLSTFVGRFNQMDATLDFDPENLRETNLQALVDITSIDVNNPGLEKELTGSGWFNAEQFPQAHLKTLSVEPLQDSNQFLFNAELTLLGVTRPIYLTATFHGGANNVLTGYYTLGFSAKGSLMRADFGMDSYIPLVGNEVTIEVYAEFQKQ